LTSAAYSAHPALAVAADVVLPALCVLAVAMPALAMRNGRLKFPTLFWTGVVVLVALVYLIRFASHSSHWWFGSGQRYSTHTAVAIVAGVTLSVYRRWMLPIAAVVVAGYLWMVVCLHYHSATEVTSTLAVILPIGILCHLPWLRKGARTEDLRS
jgi:hypothetical protein